DGWTVYAAVRDVAAAETAFEHHPGLRAVRRDLREPGSLRALVGDVRPEELYNLAGESSVEASFRDPQATWESNAHVVVHLLVAAHNSCRGRSSTTCALCAEGPQKDLSRSAISRSSATGASLPTMRTG